MTMALAFLAQTLRIAIPYLFAAAGGVLAERSGIVSLTLEGFLLGGAFTAMLGSYWTGNPWIGVLAGIAGGLVLGLIHAVATIRYKADQVVSGIAINLLAVGLTRYFLKLIFDSSSNSPRVAGFAANTSTTALVTGLLHNPLIPIGLLVVPVLAWVIYRTPFGLRVRAVGEHPEAAATLGVSVKRVRYFAVAMSGGLAALGGAYLALDQHQFTDGMSAGRGFIALAAVIFGKWRPGGALAAALLFGFSTALAQRLPAFSPSAAVLFQALPYVLTLIAVAGIIGRSRPPAAVGQPYVKE
jgi:general nucleoside transport system permease protein